MCLTVQRRATITSAKCLLGSKCDCGRDWFISTEAFHSLQLFFFPLPPRFFLPRLASLLHVPPCKHRPPPVEVGKVQIAFALGFELWR